MHINLTKKAFGLLYASPAAAWRPFGVSGVGSCLVSCDVAGCPCVMLSSWRTLRGSWGVREHHARLPTAKRSILKVPGHSALNAFLLCGLFVPPMVLLVCRCS